MVVEPIWRIGDGEHRGLVVKCPNQIETSCIFGHNLSLRLRDASIVAYIINGVISK